MRNLVQLGALIASTFAVALFFLVGRPSGDGGAPDAESAPAADIVQDPAADCPLRSRESAPPTTVVPPPADADRVGQSSRPGAEKFTAEEIAQLVAADPEFGRAIAAMLEDPDPEVRRNAAELFNAFLNASDTPAGGMPRRPD